MFSIQTGLRTVFCGARSVAVSRALNSSLQTFDEWVTENKSLIPIEEGKAATASGAT